MTSNLNLRKRIAENFSPKCQLAKTLNSPLQKEAIFDCFSMMLKNSFFMFVIRGIVLHTNLANLRAENGANLSNIKTFSLSLIRENR